MNMKRAAIFLLAAMFLAVSLSACGNGELLLEIFGLDSNAPAVGPSAQTQPTAKPEPIQTTGPGSGGGGESFVPTEAEVLALREKVTEGMTDEDISALRKAIVNANLGLEHFYFYDDFFDRLSDPESLYWNYFEKTGEIQIGWAESSDGTRSEVVTTNDFVMEDYIKRLQALKESVVSGLLDADFDRLMDLLPAAKQSHDVAYVEEFYHMVHDMDYFLLRYGLTDVGPYVVDTSTVTLYYGSLKVWNGPAACTSEKHLLSR